MGCCNIVIGVPENPSSFEVWEPQKKGWGWAQWILIVGLVVVGVGLTIPVFNGVAPRARVTQATNNCRQIIISLKSYASDHGGKYPEGATSNDVFRELIKAGLLEDERVFSSPENPYAGDNNLGAPPDYAQAVLAGENHWAMTKDLTDSSPDDTPLVFENPTVKSWPPLWNTLLVEVPKPGRVWKGGKVVVGRADGSVNLERLKAGERLTSLAPVKDGKNLFELVGPHEILDVAK